MLGSLSSPSVFCFILKKDTSKLFQESGRVRKQHFHFLTFSDRWEYKVALENRISEWHQQHSNLIRQSYQGFGVYLLMLSLKQKTLNGTVLMNFEQFLFLFLMIVEVEVTWVLTMKGTLRIACNLAPFCQLANLSVPHRPQQERAKEKTQNKQGLTTQYQAYLSRPFG